MNSAPSPPPPTPAGYRGRLAPSPTGYMHLGHARTFWTAHERAQAARGSLLFRTEDLDPARSKPHFADAMIEDLRWFGIHWSEGPDIGGPFAPYTQSQRRPHYAAALKTLAERGFLFPCCCSRKEIERATLAPNLGDEEPIYPGACRERCIEDFGRFLSTILQDESNPPARRLPEPEPLGVPGAKARKLVSGHSPSTLRAPNWRFRVPDGETISFVDAALGPQQFVAGHDFGDFVVWRHDDVPAYQLAVVVDDAAMGITEVVRGRDLLVSTARQLLLYRALGWEPPRFFHCPLMTDASGARLAKRHDALSLRSLRERGQTPESIRGNWTKEDDSRTNTG